MEEIQNIYLPAAHVPATIIKWLAQPGDVVVKQTTPLLVYECDIIEQADWSVDSITPTPPSTTIIKKKTRLELISPYEGTLSEFLVKPGELVQESRKSIARVIEPCGHAVQLHGLCALCGKDLSIADFSGSDTFRAQIKMTHDALGVTVSAQEAARIENENATRLLEEKKLSLILDLDQTIIHATVDPTVGEWMADPDNPNFPALKWEDIVLMDRPGTREFLQHITTLFEMHIYTMGTRNYAEAVANVIDPDKHLFKERILSRDESGSFAVKSIQRLFPCNQSMVVVVDDRGDIWDWPSNLIKVHPYNFFVGIGDINEPMYAASQVVNEVKEHHVVPPTPSKLTVQARNALVLAEEKAEEAGDEKGLEIVLQEMNAVQNHAMDEEMKNRPMMKEAMKLKENNDSLPSNPPSRPIRQRPVLVDNDTELEIVTRILDRIHLHFYTQKNLQLRDVGVILPKIKSKVLQGVRILFSSVIPLGVEPSNHEVWRLATSYGATCVAELDATITHVVAAKKGTLKVNNAKKIPGVCIVTPEWLYRSAAKWERQNEQDFLLDPTSSPIRVATDLNTLTSSIDDEDHAIASGLWEHKDDIFVKFGDEDWGQMNDEVDAAMMEDDDSEHDSAGPNHPVQPSDEEDPWADFDEEFEKGLAKPSQEKRGASPPVVPVTVKKQKVEIVSKDSFEPASDNEDEQTASTESFESHNAPEEEEDEQEFEGYGDEDS